MASKNTSSQPVAKSSLDKIRNEVASSLNIQLKEGYNGDLTSREAGSIGGEMVKRMVSYAAQHMPGTTK